MKKNDKYLDLMTSIDVLNTVNGGVSEPQLNLGHFEEYRQIRLKVPGIKQEDVHIEIHNNTLSVYYFINIVSNEKLIQLPRFIYNKSIPYFVNISKISAVVEDNDLVINLPFNDLANGFHKEIKINQN